MRRVRLLGLAMILLAAPSALQAQDDGRGFAEDSMQAYLAMWDEDVSATSVERFYAPHVVYYGKQMTRAQVLADKLAFVRSWPVRRSKAVPGSFVGRCNADRSRCEIMSVMTWQRVGRDHRVSNGRARIRLTFVPVGAARKIAEESAVLF